MLGAADSGKSTFVKQLKVIHKDGFSHTEIIRYTAVLRENCLHSMQLLLESPTLNLPPELENYKQEVEQAGSNSEDLVNCYRAIMALWSEHTIKEAFFKRGEARIQIPSTSDYYFENAERFASETFQPTPEDILRAKMKTTGVSEITFEINNIEFIVVDVGGQRSERRKWIHCFDDVNVVIFLAALDEYDTKLDEDRTVNRMEESLQLFKDITSCMGLRPDSWILFLNKSDLFESKIKQVPLSNYFPISAEKGSNYEAGCKYIQKLYEKNFRGKKFFTFVTCGLDTNNCKKVFDIVRETAIISSLEAL